MDSLYNENHIWGRLFRKFMDLFPQATKPTKKLLALFLIGQLCTEYFTSVRNLHKTFLSSVCDKKINSYYHALSNDKIANTQIRQILAKMSETNYYEHKTFWSIDKYMVRKHIGIERLLNMINIAHSMTKILLYIDSMFYEYRNMSAQEFRHKLNELINKEIFLAVWLIVPKLPKIPISSWSSWQLWVGIRVMQRKNCKVLSI